jgi:hypothetical protein
MADPTVADVFDQLVLANGKLDQLSVSTSGQANAISQLDSDVTRGFNDTVNALNRIAAIETAAVKMLFHLTQQADTMICALEHISRNTCEMLNQVTIQTQLQTRIRDDADVLRDIEESSHPEGALLQQRLAALHEQIERCCPPEKPEPACTYEPCPRPHQVGMPELPQIHQSEPPRNEIR